MGCRVFVAGATGKVGMELIRQTYSNAPVDNIKPEPMNIVGLASSTHYLYSRYGISEKDALSFSRKELTGRKHDSLYSMIRMLRRDPLVMHIVDATSGRYMQDFHIGIITSTHHSINTANKNPLVYSNPGIFIKLTSDKRRYRYSCSVMAGAGAVECVEMIVNKGGRVTMIEGCLSGTIGFVLSKMENGLKPSSAIDEAVRLGYAEPDWEIDMNGGDVAKKIIILARTAGIKAEMRDVTVVPLLERGAAREAELMLRANNAITKGMRLKYIARMSVRNGGYKISVKPEEVPAGSALGMLEGNMNRVTISVEGSESAISMKAPGAGAEVTAKNIRRGLLCQIDPKRSAYDA